MSLARAFQGSRVLLTALELDVFTALGEGPQTSEEVAAARQTDPRATDRLLNALVALELLTKEAGQFRNTPLTQAFLVAGQPGYVGGALRHTANLWHTWSTLTDAVRAGRSVVADPINERGPEWLASFIAAMHHNASRRAPEVIRWLELDGVRRVLDVGGGSGAYAMALAQAKPDLEVVVFDLPSVIPLTQGYVAAAGLSDRIAMQAGDYTVDELGTGFDLAFLSAIIHINSPEQNRALLAKCARALNPGGQIVIQDFIMDEDRTTPAGGALFALNMLVGTQAGDTYTEAEVQDWLQGCGFTDFRRIDPPGGAATLLCARLSHGPTN